MKKLIATIIFIILLTNTFHGFSQFSGGAGSGYDSDISVNYLLNEPLYNDLQMVSISEPADNAILNISTPYDLVFTLKNLGPYPIFPEDTIFYDFNFGLTMVINSYCFTIDTLQPNDTLQVHLNNFLLFSDTTGFEQLCISLKKTSFADDTIISNNNICHNVKISDPSGIYSPAKKTFISYYNSDKKMIVIKTTSEIKNIVVADLLGRPIPFVSENSNNETHISLNTHHFGLVFLTLVIEHQIYPLKIVVY